VATDADDDSKPDGMRKHAAAKARAQRFQPAPPPLSAKLISQLQGAVKAARTKRLTEDPAEKPETEE
jgi:hypothetical protein